MIGLSLITILYLYGSTYMTRTSRPWDISFSRYPSVALARNYDYRVLLFYPRVRTEFGRISSTKGAFFKINGSAGGDVDELRGQGGGLGLWATTIEI